MKRSIGPIVLLLAAAIFIVMIPSCAKKEGTVVQFALMGSPDTLDPHKTSGTLTFQAVRSFYDTLVEPDADGNIIPALAESWTVSPDNLTWTFVLRKGVTFHNGDKLTSADVKASFERLVSLDGGKASEFSSIESINTPDESTVVLSLSSPYAPLLATLASGWSAILPAGLIAADHDFGSSPVGTGPFTLVEWIRDGKIVLEKNPRYWMKGVPKIDGVVMNIITEQTVMVQGVITGALDIVQGLNETDVPGLEANPEVTVEKDLSALVMVLAMNTSRPYLSDLRVRQAVNYAVDKQAVLDVAYGGGDVVGTFMDSGDPFYRDFVSLYPFDPERAKKLVAEAALPADSEFVLALPQNFEPHIRAGELYQEMLRNAGLNVKIRLVDWSTWLSDVYRGGDYDMTVIGHTGKLDPDGRLGGYGTDKTYVKWVNEETAALIEKARVTIGFEERKALYDRVLEIMALEVPHVYVGTSYRFNAFRTGITGFRMDTKLDTFDFRYVEKK